MLKVAIIGSGFGVYGLLPAFDATAGCRVVAMCGTHPRLLDRCRRIGIKDEHVYTDWRLMLKNEDLDAIVLAVTPAAQYEIAKAAIKKGLHVFAEKPLAANYREALELLALAEKHTITHAVDFIFPETDEFRKVKELLDKKTYGALKHVSLNWDFLSYDIKNKVRGWKTNVRVGGGALSFYFSHSLYYLEYFMGRISVMHSMLSHSKESLSGGETGVDMVMRFKGGTSGYAQLACNARGPYRHRLSFICEKATIVLENKSDAIIDFSVKIYEDGKTRELAVTHKYKDKRGEDPRVKTVRRIADRFVRACSKKRPMTPSFRDGARVQKLIEEIRAERSINRS